MASDVAPSPLVEGATARLLLLRRELASGPDVARASSPATGMRSYSMGVYMSSEAVSRVLLYTTIELWARSRRGWAICVPQVSRKNVPRRSAHWTGARTSDTCSGHDASEGSHFAAQAIQEGLTIPTMEKATGGSNHARTLFLDVQFKLDIRVDLSQDDASTRPASLEGSRQAWRIV